MGELCERMRGDLEIAGFSPSTSRIYLMCARHFARCHMRNAAELGRYDVREFLLHLAERKVSPCAMRQVRASLTFLYTTTLLRPIEVEHLPLQRRMKRWPLALSGAEVGQMLGMIRKDSYRVMVMARDSAGLCSREAVWLRAEDLERVSEHRAEEPVRILDIDFAIAVGPVLARVVRALAGVIDDVRRVGRNECCGLAVPYAMHVGDARAVAAEQAVVAEDPQVARLGDRDRWRGLGARVVVPYMHSVLAPGEVATDGPVPHAVSEPSSVRLPPSWVRLR
jgi:hypothetical protein